MRLQRIWLAVLCMAVLLLAGCKPDNAATGGDKTSSADKGVFAEITDFANRKITLQKKPERVVVLAPSLLSYVDTVGGKIVGRPTGKEKDIPPSMLNIPEVGHVYNVSMEKVVSLKPDLVILNAQLHDKFIKMLDSSHIPTVVLQPKTYDEIKQALLITGKIFGNEAAAVEQNKKMDREVQGILAKVPAGEHKKIVILHATPSTVTVELENSIAGGVAKLLGFKNVAGGAKAVEGGPERTPYSIEALVEQDPEILFITSMGAREKIESRLQADVKGNPAYAALRAVRQQKVYVLPENLFLLNPGLRYPEAVKLMAKDVYPELFN